MTARSILCCVFACLCVSLCLALPIWAVDDGDDTGRCDKVPYKARAGAAVDLIASPTNFLMCNSGQYALCYYSGADPLPCTVDGSSETARCQCQVLDAADGPMYVDINSILDECAYQEAIEQCGEDGSGCLNICDLDDPEASVACKGIERPENPPTAYVCDYIASNEFDEAADFISTFSFATVSAPNSGEDFDPPTCNRGFGQYAGCMTASCFGQMESQGHTYTDCTCPLWPIDGTKHRFQFGRACVDGSDDLSPGNCSLKEGAQVWSAAFNPLGCGPPDGSGDAD